MEKYLTQLHSDLVTARRPMQDPIDDVEDEEKEDPIEATMASFEEAERYAAGEIPTKKFGDACGIQKIQFPPAEKLTEAQIVKLCESIEDLMWSWHIDITLPETLPPIDRYHFLTEVFDTETMIVRDGQVGIELCDYEVEGCVFGEYCMCLEFEAEAIAKEEIDEDVLLFIVELDEKLSDTEKLPIKFIFQAQPVIEAETQSIQTLADWLQLSIEDFPDEKEIQISAAIDISNILFRLWYPDDEMVLILRGLDPLLRYKKLKDYLESKIWFDSKGILFFIPVPMPKLPDLLEGMDLDFGPDPDEEEDLDLPF